MEKVTFRKQHLLSRGLFVGGALLLPWGTPFVWGSLPLFFWSWWILFQLSVEEKKEKESILESLSEGVVAVDDTLNIREVNCIGSRMLGTLKRHLIGNRFPSSQEARLSPLFTQCHAVLRACQKTGQIVTDAAAVGDLHKQYIDLIAVPQKKGRGVLLILQDKSSHHKVLDMGKDFVANASHELRTPITIIKGFAETLQDFPELATQMLGDITEKIVRNCVRMETLVKNLLTLADLENLPETRFSSCDLVPLIENCRHMVEGMYPGAHVAIGKIQEEVVVEADPDILELALSNLLHNAAKYSTSPAQIHVGVTQLREDVQITIADKGIGIPAQDLDQIFERFYTVNKAHSRRLGGAGLGLSIVKTIIEKHQGTIQVASTLGKGTTFTICLPLRRP